MRTNVRTSHSQDCNLYLSDFPLHDMARDFALLSEAHQVELELKEQLEVRNNIPIKHYAFPIVDLRSISF